MNAHRRLFLVLPLLTALLCAALPGCKKEAAKPAKPVREDLVAGAVELLGGVAQLKSGRSFSARYKANLLGNKIKGTISYNTGDIRLKYFNAAGDAQIHQVTAAGKCWQQYDKVVIPCLAERATHTTQLARLLSASHFFPLVEAKDLKTRDGELDLKGKKYKTVTVTAGQEVGALLLDPDSYRVVGIKMQTKIGGKAGELLGLFSKFEKNCGTPVATQREYTFAGQPYLREEISGLICEKVDPAIFAEPKQVEHLKVDLRHTANVDLACYKLKGSLDGLTDAMGKIEALLQKHEVGIEGPAQLVHRKGPPKSKRQERWLTEVCYPVQNKAWHLPKGTWEGEYKLFERYGDEYLRVFGVGDYAKNTSTMADTLVKEARKMKRKQVASMVQVLFMHPKHYPAAQRISEMHLPMD